MGLIATGSQIKSSIHERAGIRPWRMSTPSNPTTIVGSKYVDIKLKGVMYLSRTALCHRGAKSIDLGSDVYDFFENF